MGNCNCGPKKTLHQVVHPSGATITYKSEDEARAVAAQVGGTYQAQQL
ncbi:hypothetical protein IU459_11805 [Nocardia amamiensis]|uniref:Uncharacterized protein n=1 Tax=Nocardia amamiensis TaxID=404578 RepID=A0ABS0CNL8_9NOCA|nr:hypothetical protein [Nocardia amamiensis]MBF6298225.1 hypothetical protein [Nocardia amamiensis]